MATLVLPVRSDVAAFDFETDLEGRSFTFAFRWNARAGLWFVSIYDAIGAPVVEGRAVVLGSDLRGLGVDPRRPPGSVLAVETDGEIRDPGRRDLGGRVLIVYVESTGA